MPYTLPLLKYQYDALEPHIDARTMELHHGKHHQAYIDKLNGALAGTEWENLPIEELLKRIADLPEDKRMIVRNHGGGHFNHTFFWGILSPRGGGEPSGELAKEIRAVFGSFQAFQEQFTAAALNRFGSGWAWLIADDHGKISIQSTANQDCPLMGTTVAGCAGTPIVGLDVWEHAYYLKYQNRRAEYITAFWKIIDWHEAERRHDLIVRC